MANASSSLALMQADIDNALQLKQDEKLKHDANCPLITIKSGKTLSKIIEAVDNTGLNESQLSRVIEMAWEDRTPFAAIEHSYGLNESAVIKLMRQQLKPSSFRLWRQRVTGRVTKNQAKRTFIVGRAHCKTQYKPR